MDYTEKLKQMLEGIRYACMATVNIDGSPHNSPLVFIYDSQLKYVYWGSHPDATHSANILRTGQAYFTAFDSRVGMTGLYLKVARGRVVEGADLTEALAVHNHFRAIMGKDAIDLSYYEGGSPQKMWRAEVEQIWINAYERGKDGRLIKDYKIEIPQTSLGDLWG